MYVGLGLFAGIAILLVLVFMVTVKRRRDYEATGDDRLE